MTEQVATVPFYPRKSRVIHLILLIVLCCVNTGLGYTVSPDIVNLAGIPMPKTDWERLLGAAMTIFVSYNFVGFLVASFVSMVPYKATTYGQRYVKIAFLTMILVQIGFLAYGIALAAGLIHPKMVF